MVCSDSGGVTDFENAWRCYNENGRDTEYDVPPNYYSYDIPALHGPTSPGLDVLTGLEAITSSSHGWGEAYYSTLGAAAGYIVNFHNLEDIALEGWEFNQLTKPDLLGGPSWSYEYDFDCGIIGCQAVDFPESQDNDLVTDVYERDDGVLSFAVELNWANTVRINAESSDILAHIIPSRTNALGQRAMKGVNSVINGALDLNGLGYLYGHSNFDHSAAFYRSYSERCSTWLAMLENMNIEVFTSLTCN